MELIYLDNNATTRPAREVIEAAIPAWSDTFANPSSQHLAGQSARRLVEEAREQVATLIGAKPREIVFTSGGTEADNLAIRGVLAGNPSGRHVVTTAVEHVAVRDLCARLANDGYRVTTVGVDRDGRLDLCALSAAITRETAIVSVMHANNETGVIFPIRDVAAITKSRGVPLHVDAVQSAGKIQIQVDELGADLLSLSAHKMHGLKGAGALYVRSGVRIRSQLVGGHQERDLRPGTEPVPAIVTFGIAARWAMTRISNGEMSEVGRLRDHFERTIVQRIPAASINGGNSPRVPNTTNIAFAGLSAEAILIGLSQSGICASSGSACSSGALEPSHVLTAMGLGEDTVNGSIRFSLSHETEAHELETAVAIVEEIVGRLRTLDGVRGA